MSNDWKNPQTCEYLASFGLDPGYVLVDGHDAEGYCSPTMEESPYGGMQLLTEWHPWPEGFDYAQYLACWAADEPHRERRR